MADLRRAGLAVGLVAILSLGACDQTTPATDRSASSSPSAATKGDPGPQRHDLDPLTQRYAALGAPVSATWYGGTYGDSRVPGPTTYWIDAVVILSPGTTKTLAAQAVGAETADISDPPTVIGDLAPALPDGPLVTSTALTDEFSSPDWSTRVWLDADSNTLVLQAQGQGE